MSEKSAPSRELPRRVGKPSRDTGRVFGADLAHDTAARRAGPTCWRPLLAYSCCSKWLRQLFCLVAGWSWAEALEAFVATNAAIGLSFGICGAILAWHRPHNPIGWLFAAGGIAQSTAALAAPLLSVLHQAAAPIALQRLVITIFSWSWPWSIGLFLPLALLLFPDGRPLSRGWRWVVIAVIITAPLFALEMGASPDAPSRASRSAT